MFLLFHKHHLLINSITTPPHSRHHLHLHLHHRYYTLPHPPRRFSVLLCSLYVSYCSHQITHKQLVDIFQTSSSLHHHSHYIHGHGHDDELPNDEHISRHAVIITPYSVSSTRFPPTPYNPWIIRLAFVRTHLRQARLLLVPGS